MKDHRVSTAVSHCFLQAFLGVVSNRGAVFLFAKYYGAVRCGAVRIIAFENRMVKGGSDLVFVNSLGAVL